MWPRSTDLSTMPVLPSVRVSARRALRRLPAVATFAPARTSPGALMMLLVGSAAAFFLPAALAATNGADAPRVAASAATTRARPPTGDAHAGTVLAAPHAASGVASGARGMRPKPVAKPEKLVDINSASAADLMKLPGIGAAEAERIVAGRPYRTSADLATNNIVPTGVYIALRRSVVALPPGGARKGGATSKVGAARPAGSASGAGRSSAP